MGKRNLKRKKIKLSSEVVEIMRQQMDLFKEMYGREITHNTENPYFFWHIGEVDINNNWDKIICMRSANIEEAKIYASYRTGLIPTEYNYKLLSSDDIDEFNYYYDEFNSAMESKPENGSISRLLFVRSANTALEDHITNRQLHICLAANDFIVRHLINKKNFQSYQITSELDFLGYSLLKLRKDLECLEILQKKHCPENMYPICRSIYETYIYLSAIRNHKDFFSKYILSQPLSVNNNKYSDFIFNSAKAKRPNLKFLASKSPFPNDRKLHDCFYNSACQFIHLDPFSAKGYFHGSDPYDEIDPCLTSYVIGIALSTFALYEVSNIAFCDKQYRTDLKYLIAGIKDDLLECFLFLRGNPFYDNDIFKTFEARLNEIEIEPLSHLTISSNELERAFENLTTTDHLPQELNVMLAQLYAEFIDMYGRTLLEKENEYAYSLLFYNMRDYQQSTINSLREEGVEEAKIFTYYATGYHILDDVKKDQAKEEQAAYKVYNLFKTEKAAPTPYRSIQRIKYILKTNTEVDAFIKKNTKYILHTSGDFVRRHIEQHQDFLDYEIKTELDFIGFCLKKMQKDFDTLSILHKECMVENMFVIARSFFDMYLFIANINSNKDFFEKEILSQINNSSVHFDKDTNGVIKYNSLIFDTTSFKSQFTKKDLAKQTIFPDDIDFYQIFYGSLSQFVHLSPLIAQCYFTESDPYEDIDSGMMAFSFAIFCSTIFLDQCIDTEGVKPMYKQDLQILTKKIKGDLIKTFEIFKFIEPENIVFNCLLNRLK